MTSSDTEKACQPVPGTLYVLATPIGHLADLSPRARTLLAEVDLIAAEDTRVTRRLPGVEAARGRLVSLNEHTEQARVDDLTEALAAGQSVALVSDAGTPLISDPGYRLVAAAHAAGLRVCPVPGPCAAIAALSVAGLPTDRFWFEGFLPPRAAARQRRLRELAGLTATLVFYVPARDLELVLRDMVEVLEASRPACLARELTKRHETVLPAKLDELLERVRQDLDQLRGEAVLVVGGAVQERPAVVMDVLVRELASALPPSKAAAVLARVSGLKRREAWRLVEGLSADARISDASISNDGDEKA